MSVSRKSSVNPAVLIPLLWALPALALQPLPDARVPLRVRTITESHLEGTLISLSLEGGLRLNVEGEQRQIDTRDLISISRTDFGTPSVDAVAGPSLGRDEVALELVGGDRIFGRLGQSKSESIAVETEAWGQLTLSMERLTLILFSNAELPAYSDSLRWFRRQNEATDDRLLLTNGDVVRGFVTGVDREGLRMEVGDEVSTIPLRLAVAAKLVHPPARVRQVRQAIVSLVDGQRLTVAELEWNGDKARARIEGGEMVEPPGDRIASIAFEGGRWTWLSAMSPARAEHTPMLSLEWKHALDRNVLGGPLRVAGVRFERGIGVHSKSVLTYELDGTYKEFVTSFGMDDDSGRGASVNAIVLVDGRQRFERNDVVPGVLHGPVRVDVAEAHRLELVVDFGLNGDIQDRFDWVEPGLVKPGE